ncbi:MAG: ribonuclease P protein component [Actinomycetota bacterium]
MQTEEEKVEKFYQLSKPGSKNIILESIKKEEDIKKLFKNGIYINKKYFIIYMNRKESKESNIIRTRFIVTKKIGSAVIRNRIKRLLREILRLINNNNFAEIELIIIAKKNIRNIGFWELNAEILKIVK